MYKLLAMDLDETLFNDDHIIDKKNREYIKKAKDKGVYIVPCSGRGPGFLGTLYDDLDLNHTQEYSILANGAVVIENKTNKIIKCFGLSYEKMKELFEFAINKKICVQVFTTTHVYMYNLDDAEYERVKDFGSNIIIPDNHDVSFLKDETILKVLYQKANGMDYFHELAKEMEPLTKDCISVSFSSNRYLELNAKGIHKGIGLQALADYLSIDISETIGVGDNFNDLGLIETAGLGIAVQNAIKEIKDISKAITKANNNENAIAEVIETYIL